MYSFDHVGSINKPAFVVPSSLQEDDSYQPKKQLQLMVRFTSVPMSFLFRGNWSTMDNQDTKFTKSEFDSGDSKRSKRKLLSKLVTISANDMKKLADMAEEAVEMEADVDSDDEDDAENMRDNEELNLIQMALGDGDNT